MLTLTRLLLRQWQTVFKRALRLTTRGPTPTLHIITGPTGLVLRANSADVFLEYRTAEPQPAEQFSLPFAVLAELQGPRRDPVTLEVVNPKVLEARWHEQGVAHQRQYPLASKTAADFPPIPETMAANPPTILNALREAFTTTDTSSSRYALNCVQVRGQHGMLAATDGHQMLQQNGFQFGFNQDVLVQPTRIFEGTEWTDVAAVQVGRGEKHLVLQAGPWTVWLPLLAEGRFPRTDDILPQRESATTRVELSAVDAAFLAENVPRMPLVEPNQDVTLDLNGSVIIRGKSASTPLPTELVLRNSTKEGADLRIASDRRFLVRAAKLGLRQIYFRAADQTILAQDATRSYVWMPLAAAGCTAPATDALRIESPVPTRLNTSPSHIPPTNMTTKPSETPVTAPSPTKPLRRQSRSTSKPAGAMEQATLLRDQLRTLLGTTKELIRALKIENRSRKSLKLALDSLKQLHAA